MSTLGRRSAILVDNTLPRLISPSAILFLIAKHFSTYLAFVFCCYVHPCFGLKDLGVEETQNWLDKPSEERNLTNRSRGASYSSMHTMKSIGREGMA